MAGKNFFFQTRLLKSLSLPKNGRPKVQRDSSVQLCESSRELSAFPSFMRKYLAKVIKADQCAQYADDIGIAANTAEQLIKTLRATFQCIRQCIGGLKTTLNKCPFGATKIDFTERTITPEEVKSQRYLGFLTY